MLKKQIAMLSGAVDNPGPLLDGLGARLGAIFGGGDAPPAPPPPPAPPAATKQP